MLLPATIEFARRTREFVPVELMPMLLPLTEDLSTTMTSWPLALAKTPLSPLFDAELSRMTTLTGYTPEELIGRQIMGVLNFKPREIGGVVSEFLCLGVQFPKADSGDATIITPLVEAKLGSKLF